MSDGNSDQGATESVFAPSGTPVAYAEFVSNLAYSREVVKYYFVRNDPAINAVGPAQPNVVAQVVMSTPGFLATAAFFSRMVSQMVREGVVTQEQVDFWRQSDEGREDEADA
ncbi:MAG: hypothetical protein ACMVY4_19235 [Minwuia sp.]|uniref:hypothetical protein n=1 Tax=Minwuia sp. TaxID=2493630 RepID=UPI003A888CC8